ncbi:toll/interleukin-1 receptor domain-containing protein [Streptococcus sinensis]|uniref:toll/interleukin-1 receptor domain-containing protein n=1 Tax=Streptococcus sinensis TaxID=176090 RepID=UPI001C2EB396|nr:toll/interleukin-1 receptor domain-containing protein [Streptococcus sinensis]
MKKVFISHSSKDKDFFVRPLVNNLKKSLGEDRLVYDELTFESGAKIIEEIRQTIDMTDLFVILLSENSLSSEWVKQEILWAKNLDSNFLDEQRIMPVIIDDITKDNQEIPEWLKNIT